MKEITMISMKYKELTNKKFHATMQWLSNQRLAVKPGYQLMKIIQDLEKGLKVIASEWQNLVDRYAEKDKDGQVVFEQAFGFKPKEEIKEEAIKAASEFGDRLYQIDRNPLTLQDLQTIDKISANELILLSPIYVELSAVS